MLYILLFYYLFSLGFIGCMLQDYENIRNEKIDMLYRVLILIFLSPFLLPIILGAYIFRLCEKIEDKNE